MPNRNNFNVANKYPPSGWLMCNGNSFDSSTYPGLYSVLGSTTLPNFNARFPIGVGSGNGTNTWSGYGNYEGSISISINEKGGSPKHTLTTNEMPKHRHNWFGDDDLQAFTSNWGGTKVAQSGDYDADSWGGYQSNIYSTSETGGGSSHYIMPPYYGIYFIIKAKHDTN